MKDYVIATETFHVATKDGTPRTIIAGSSLETSDPAVKASPDRFKTAEQIAEVVEVRHTATEQVPAEQDEAPASEPTEDDEAGPITTASVPAVAKRKRG